MTVHLHGLSEKLERILPIFRLRLIQEKIAEAVIRYMEVALDLESLSILLDALCIVNVRIITTFRSCPVRVYVPQITVCIMQITLNFERVLISFLGICKLFV